MFLSLLLSVGLPIALFFIVLEVANRIVYGALITETNLDAFFEKNLKEYSHLNPLSETILSTDWRLSLPFISHTSGWFPVFTSKYYINDFGTIPRWSKWTKVLDGRYADLNANKPPKQSLADL